MQPRLELYCSPRHINLSEDPMQGTSTHREAPVDDIESLNES